MARKKTYEEVKKEFEDEGYTLLSKEYKGNEKQLLSKCPNGHTHKVSRGAFVLRGVRCQTCRWIEQRKNPEEIREFLSDIGYKWISGDYISAHKKIQLECDRGHQYWQRWAGLQAGKRCPECQKEDLSNMFRLNFDDVLVILKDNDVEYVSGEYINGKSKLILRCPIHGEFERSLQQVQHAKHKCPKCARKYVTESQRKDFNEILEAFEKEGYSYISGKYLKNTSKLKVECPNGHIFYTSWDVFNSGKRCPVCNESKGEAGIRIFLKKNKINFVRQKRFNDCRDIKPLPFDFYIKHLNTAIEYQGKQHFFNMPFFGGEEEFKGRKRRDRIKRKFCKENKIKLIEIKYTQFDNIEKILAKELGITQEGGK